jgi:hypothetical protein
MFGAAIEISPVIVVLVKSSSTVVGRTMYGKSNEI